MSFKFCQLLLVIFILSAQAQEIIWPEALISPEIQDEEDSTGLKYSLQQEKHEYSSKSQNEITYNKNDSNYYTSHSALFVYTNDMGNREFYLNMSGNYLQKNLVKNLNSGIEWNPKLSTKPNLTSSLNQSWLDIGPILQGNLYTVPFMTSGGLSAWVWNKNVKYNSIRTFVDSAHSDLGYFIHTQLGSIDHRLINSFPLWVDGEIYTTQTGISNKLILDANAFSAFKLFRTDSLFASINQEYSEGNQAVLNDRIESGPLVISDPQKNKKLNYHMGIQGEEIWSLTPKFWYNFLWKSTEYPNIPANNLITRTNIFATTMHSKSEKRVRYYGAFQIGNDNYDYLNSSNNQDFNELLTIMEYGLNWNLTDSSSVNYKYKVSRDSKTMLDRADPESKRGNFDYLIRQHQISIIPIAQNKLYLKISGDYFTSGLYYLDKSESGTNRIIKYYALGTTFEYQFSPICSLQENISISTQPSKFVYPQFNEGVYAPYNRNVNSKMLFGLGLNKFLQFKIEWIEDYRDDGYWTGRELSEDNGYYAIDSKVWDHEVTFSNKSNLPFSSTMEAGFTIGDVFYQSWIDGRYQLSSLQDDGYSLTPFIKASTSFEDKISGIMDIRRHIYTNAKSYWEFGLFLQGTL